MSTPSKAFNVADEGFTLWSAAARQEIAAKLISLNQTNRSAVVTTGTSGLKRRRLLLRADEPNTHTVYIGGLSVTPNNGWPLYPNDEIELDLDDAVTVKAIIEEGTGITGKLNVLELQ